MFSLCFLVAFFHVANGDNRTVIIKQIYRIVSTIVCFHSIQNCFVEFVSSICCAKQSNWTWVIGRTHHFWFSQFIVFLTAIPLCENWWKQSKNLIISKTKRNVICSALYQYRKVRQIQLDIDFLQSIQLKLKWECFVLSLSICLSYIWHRLRNHRKWFFHTALKLTFLSKLTFLVQCATQWTDFASAFRERQIKYVY